jgi:hypothetical protein
MTDEEQKAPFDTHDDDDDTAVGDTPEHDSSAEAEGEDKEPAERDLPEGKYKGGVIGGESEADPVTDVGQDAPTPG